MITAMSLLLWQLTEAIDGSLSDVVAKVRAQGNAYIFVFDDWHSKQHFVKQFFSGIFIAIVMTGLDQDMMQKNLTCRNLPNAKEKYVLVRFVVCTC